MLSYYQTIVCYKQLYCEKGKTSEMIESAMPKVYKVRSNQLRNSTIISVLRFVVHLIQ